MQGRRSSSRAHSSGADAVSAPRPATGPTLGQLLLAIAALGVTFALGRSVGETAARHAMPLACLDSSATGAP